METLLLTALPVGLSPFPAGLSPLSGMPGPGVAFVATSVPDVVGSDHMDAVRPRAPLLAGSLPLA